MERMYGVPLAISSTLPHLDDFAFDQPYHCFPSSFEKNPEVGKAMKLIVAGASGFVATEVIRQSLSIPKITSVIALARRPISTPPNLGQDADTSKLHSVALDNYGSYPDDVKEQLAGADACIWYVLPLSLFKSSPLAHAFIGLTSDFNQPVNQAELMSLGPSRLHQGS